MARHQRLLFAPVGRKKGAGQKAGKTTPKNSNMPPVTDRKKKAGRPVKAVRKEIRVTIRFTRSEYFIIQEKALKAGRSTAGYMRELAINAQIISRLTTEERMFVRQLAGMANNLNQLAKSCHQEGSLKAMFYFQTFLAHLEDILKKLKP
jgi:hypothetical protein